MGTLAVEQHGDLSVSPLPYGPVRWGDEGHNDPLEG